ncbi:MAG: helix-turn-helix transcriptional regulator [Candidatus Thorarchaeota archaeon]
MHFKEKRSKSEIARTLGIANSTVHRAFERNGWKTLPPLKKGDPEEARGLYQKGLTHREIARKLKVSRRTVGNYLKELGVKRRNRSKYESNTERLRARRERARSRRQKVRELRDKIFGKECRVCGVDKSRRKIAMHNKDLEEHEMNALWSLSFLKKLNSEEWAALCIMCHRGVHWINDELGMDWQSVENRTKERTTEEPNRNQDTKSTSHGSSRLHDLVGEVEDIRRALFGDECYFCGPLSEEKALVIHRKDGKPHRKHTLWSKDHLHRMGPDDWQALCQKHHRYVHWGMKQLGMKWEDIESAFQKNKGN